MNEGIHTELFEHPRGGFITQKDQLGGRLEEVLILHSLSDKSSTAVGIRTHGRGRYRVDDRFDDSFVVVTHGAAHVGKRCLVKFDTGNNNFTLGRDMYPLTNFVTSTFHPFFGGLSLHEYVLIGIWSDTMDCKDTYPALTEINKYYDPGEIPRVILHNGTSRCKIVTPSTILNDKSLSNTLFQYHKGKARVILTYSSHQQDVFQRVLSLGLTPILMEPITPIHDYINRIEVANIHTSFDPSNEQDKYAKATLERTGQEILVRNGASQRGTYVGRRGLVSFGHLYEKAQGMLVAQFVSSRVPEQFVGADLNKCVFYAPIPRGMEQPNANQVSSAYGFNLLEWYAYHPHQNNQEGRIYSSSGRRLASTSTFAQSLESVSSSSSGILLVHARQTRDVERAISEKGLLPIMRSIV